MQGKTLLVLGGTINQLPVICAAKELGVRVICIDPDGHALGGKLADRFYKIDISNAHACEKVAVIERIDGVLTVGADFPVLTLSKIIKNLGLCGVSIDAAIITRDKWELYNKLVDGKISVPRSYLIDSGSALKRVMTVGHYSKMVIKPRDGAGSRGVRLVAFDENKNWDRIYEDTSRHSPSHTTMLAQELVEGPEYSVECITIKGVSTVLAVTTKVVSNGEYFVEMAHSQPANLSGEIEARLCQVCIEVLKMIGIDNSASHIELKISDNRIVIIEVACRMGGGFIGTDLIKLSTGLDFNYAVTELALTGDTKISRSELGGAAVGFFTSRSGKLRKIVGFDKIFDRDGIVSANVYVKPGDVISNRGDNSSRIGHVIARGDSALDAMAAVHCAIRGVNFVIDSVHAG